MTNLDSKHYEYLLESRCNFEMQHLKALPIDGVLLPSGVSHMDYNGEQRNTIDLFLRKYKLTLRTILPPKYPLVPPTLRLMSTRDSCLPDHPHVDQSDGTIEKEFVPGDWTPAITIRAIALEVLKMLHECNAQTDDRPVTVRHGKVNGTCKDTLVLDTWGFKHLCTAGLNIVDKVRSDHRCDIRFFAKGQAGKPYLLILADDQGLLNQAKTAIERYLEGVQETVNRQRRELKSQLKLAEQTRQANMVVEVKIPTETKCRVGNTAGTRAYDRQTMQQLSGVVSAGCQGPGGGSGLNAMASAADLQPRSIAQASPVAAPAAPKPTTVHVSTCRYCYRKFPENVLMHHMGSCQFAPKDFKVRVEPAVGETAPQPAGASIGITSAPSRDAPAIAVPTGGPTVALASAGTYPTAAAVPALKDALSALGRQFMSGLDSTLDDIDRRFDGAVGHIETGMDNVDSALAENLASMLLAAKENTDDRKELKHRLEQLQNRVVCTICAHRSKDHALSCGHVFCGACAAELQATFNPCPICRKPIVSAKQLYF